MSYEHLKAYRQRRLAKARAHLGGVCAVCGSVKALQFDHIDPSTKVTAIANAIAHGWSWKRLVVELDKCQLLCQPHHLEKSQKEGSLSKPPWNKGRHHGSHHGAYVIKCTCDACAKYKVERSVARRKRLDASG